MQSANQHGCAIKVRSSQVKSSQVLLYSIQRKAWVPPMNIKQRNKIYTYLLAIYSLRARGNVTNAASII